MTTSPEQSSPIRLDARIVAARVAAQLQTECLKLGHDVMVRPEVTPAGQAVVSITAQPHALRQLVAGLRPIQGAER